MKKDTLKKYLALKKRVETLQREADEAQGAYKQVLKDLRDNHGCESIEEAERKAKRLLKEIADLEAQFEASLTKLQTDWGDKL